MPIDKRDLPLSILKAIEPIANKKSDLFRIKDKDGFLFCFEDNHEDPKHHFEIKSHKKNGNTLLLQVNIKPKGENDPSEWSADLQVTQIADYFKKWISNLDGYRSMTFFDDPLLNQYQKEFYSDFEIIDPDADENSYDLNTQMWLDKYLEQSLQLLESYPSNSEIELIKSDLKNIKENQTKLTKRKVVEALSKVYAKARKYGLKLLHELYHEAKKEIIKQLVSGKIELPG
ncbi:hypothetical protein [Ekhidna sp.]|uniref:hypothetical protein n=1 Tax=Ekhidna sp. TaxID=2608089 RepID=UPI0032EDC147